MEYFFGYIVISSNSILAIMKRNRNGISLFWNGKLLFLKRKITGPTRCGQRWWQRSTHASAQDPRWEGDKIHSPGGFPESTRSRRSTLPFPRLVVSWDGPVDGALCVSEIVSVCRTSFPCWPSSSTSAVTSRLLVVLGVGGGGCGSSIILMSPM